MHTLHVSPDLGPFSVLLANCSSFKHCFCAAFRQNFSLLYLPQFPLFNFIMCLFALLVFCLYQTRNSLKHRVLMFLVINMPRIYLILFLVLRRIQIFIEWMNGFMKLTNLRVPHFWQVEFEWKACVYIGWYIPDEFIVFKHSFSDFIILD